MFPRLHAIGKKEGRLDGLETRSSQEIIFFKSGAHEHIFPLMASYLDTSSLYNLASTCKQLRHYCLTDETYQNFVRNTLISSWAIPTVPELPSKIPDGYPSPQATGDWLLYGTHVHKTNSMRNRRRIFHILDQMEHQYVLNATEAGYLQGPNSEKMQQYLRASIEQQLLIGELNQMYDYSLFIKCMKIFNQAYKEDLKHPLFTGSEMPLAVHAVKKAMAGSHVLAIRDPGRLGKEVTGAMKERMRLFMIEKTKYAQKRKFVKIRQRSRSRNSKE